MCVLLHHLFHHLAVDQDVIHAFLKSRHVIGHELKIGGVVSSHCCHSLEAVHDILVVIHCLHVPGDELHFHSHPLNVNG